MQALTNRLFICISVTKPEKEGPRGVCGSSTSSARLQLGLLCSCPPPSPASSSSSSPLPSPSVAPSSFASPPPVSSSSSSSSAAAPPSASAFSSIISLETFGGKDLAARLLDLGLPLAHAMSIMQALPPPKSADATQVISQHVLSLVRFLRTMDINSDKIPTLVRKAPFMYHRNPSRHLEPKIQYLETLGVHRKEMHVLVLKYPYSLYPAMEDIQAQIQFLKNLPLADEDLQKVIRQCPMVFRLDANRYLQPKVNLFRSLGITPKGITRLVLTFPRVFARPLDKLQDTVAFLQELGFQSGTLPFSKAFVSIATRNQQSIRCAIQNLLDTGFSQEEVEILVQETPLLLAKNTTDICNKIKYLVEVMGRSPSDVVKCPVFLLISLKKRIQPRHEALVQWRAENNIEKQHSLSYIFSPKDEIFTQRFPGVKLESRV